MGRHAMDDLEEGGEFLRDLEAGYERNVAEDEQRDRRREEGQARRKVRAKAWQDFVGWTLRAIGLTLVVWAAWSEGNVRRSLWLGVALCLCVLFGWECLVRARARRLAGRDDATARSP